MKKARSLILCSVLMLLVLIGVTSLSACGSPKTVPDKTIEWAIEDYLKSNFDPVNMNYEYKYTVTHSPDSSTKSDTVHVDLSLNGAHYTGSTFCDMTYIYDKSSGLWTATRGGEWAPVHVDRFFNTSFSKDLVSQVFQKNGLRLDESLFEVISSDDIADTYPLEGITLLSAWAYEADDAVLIDVLVDDPDSAEKMNQVMEELLMGNALEELVVYPSIELKQTSGENYNLYHIDGAEDGGYMAGYYGYIENNLILFMFFSEYDLRLPFYKATAELGIYVP